MKITTKKACIAAAGMLLLAGCASLQESAIWNPPAIGSTWQMSQRNTGSYGKDAEIMLTREDATYDGHPVVAVTSTTQGFTLMITPDAKWRAIVGRDGKPMVTYDPPIGYVYPLKVGKSWSTHHRENNLALKRVSEFDYTCNVESFEKVTVKAGTFGAFKIVCDNELSRTVTWVSPEVGLNIKADLERKAANPSGAGRQLSELTVLQLK